MNPMSHEELLDINGTSLIYTSTTQYIYDKVIEAAKKGNTQVSFVFDLENVKKLLAPDRKPGILYSKDPMMLMYKHDPDHTFRELCRLFPQPTRVSITKYIADPPQVFKKLCGETDYTKINESIYDDTFVKKDTKVIVVEWGV